MGRTARAVRPLRVQAKDQGAKTTSTTTARPHRLTLARGRFSERERQSRRKRIKMRSN